MALFHLPNTEALYEVIPVVQKALERKGLSTEGLRGDSQGGLHLLIVPDGGREVAVTRGILHSRGYL